MSNGTELATTSKQVPIAVGNRGLALTSLDELWRFATIAHKSGLAPKDLNTTEKVFIALQWGAEVGVSPMQALKNIAVINNRACMWGELLVALVRRSPLCKRLSHVYEGTGESRVCVVTGERAGGETCEGRFGYQDAKRAGLLSKDTYRNYSDRMFLARARAFVLKDLFADLLCGLDVAEEVQDIEPSQQTVPTIQAGDDAPEDEIEAIVAAIEQDAGKVPATVYGHSDDGSLTPEELKQLQSQQDIPF